MPKLTESQRRRLGLVAKAVGGSVDGVKISDMLKAEIDEGSFDETVTLVCQLRGTKSADTRGDRYYGVPIDLLFNLSLGMLPGFTKDHMLRLQAVATEVTKADKEDRDVQAITYQDANGDDVELDAEEVERYVELAHERNDELKEAGETLSEIAKESRLVRGRVNTSYVAVKVRKGGDVDNGMTILKQTKEDLAVHGV